MAKLPAVYRQVLDEHRSRLVRLTEHRGVRRLKRLYDDAQSELVHKIERRAGSGRNAFTPLHHRVMLAQVRQGQALMAQRLAGELGDLSREAQVESLRGLTSDMHRLEREFTGTAPVLPIEEAARFAGIVDRRRTSLMRMHESSMARYGTGLVRSMEEQMALSLATGETLDDTITRIHRVAGGRFGGAERIARTETAWAYSAAAADGLAELHREMPDLYMRWNEHVSEDGAPLDDRVAVDSLAMHGQVAKPGGVFTMPSSAPNGQLVDKSLVGRSWAHPPDRPNGRETITPWKPGWGVPAWIWRGRRVPMR